MTNGDKIRNMSDEELADWLNNMCDFEKDEEPYKSIYNLDTEKEEEIHDSYGDLLIWLQSEAIQFDLKIGGEIHSQVLRDAIDVAIQALEKQIPKRPIEHFTGDEWICECPVCKGVTDTPNDVEVESCQYCAWCGQRLDWSEE